MSEVVGQVKKRTGTGRRTSAEWAEVARVLRENPGVEVLMFKDTPRVRQIQTAAAYGYVRALRNLGGVVYAHMSNSRMDRGRRVGDVYMRWDPDGDPRGRYKTERLAPDEIEQWKEKGWL